MIGHIEPNTSLFLKHTDPDSDVSVYLSSILDINGRSTGIPDQGSTAILLLGGLTGAVAFQRRRGTFARS